MNTLAQLAQASTRELNTMTSEDDPDIPDYLLADDGEFLADPASAADRAEVVLQLLRLDREAQRYAELNGPFAADEMRIDDIDEMEMDESERWAREAGFDG
jgi:hypothetical protein